MTKKVASPAAPTPVTSINVAAVTAAVDRAWSIGAVLPRHEIVQDLAAELAGYLRRLLAAVPHSGPARAATAAEPGPGLQSAADRARPLAVDCWWLLRHLAREGRTAR